MAKPRVSTLITDLDNTLYDWVGVWHECFSAMLDELASRSGIPKAQLISESKVVHQRHKTSEYLLLIEELPSLQRMHPGAALAGVYAGAIERYREARTKHLRLFPDVATTLQQIRDCGTIVVAYTESMALYTNYRMQHLGLDPSIDFLYSPDDHDLPANLNVEQLRFFPATPYKLVHARHRYTPRGKLKPNPDVLRTILGDIRASVPECVYVGDSLMKDIAMANEVGVTSVHAAYGEAHRKEQYELLKAVTHWSDDDVRREKTYKAGNASYVLRESFSELLELFQFTGPDHVVPRDADSQGH